MGQVSVVSTVTGQTAPSPTRLMVFMFTDVADSTKLKQPENLGAGAYAELARRHDALFREIAASTPGAEVLKDVGDGFMATFATASDAVRAALRFQFNINTKADFTPAASPLPFRVRVGIHQGEVSVLDLDIHGKPKLVGPAADMTARIQSLALPGQNLVSRAAFDNARQYVRDHPVCDEEGACPLLIWEAHGYYRFKGIPDSQEVFEVGAKGSSPCKSPSDTEKAHYVGSPDDEAMRGWRPALGQDIPRRTSWVLEKKIGEGGFGEVWLASQKKTKEWRVFKFCFLSDRLRSFKRELTLFRLLRDALGNRTDIARLYDVSLESPPYLLESQYEGGGNLLDWAAKQGGIEKVGLAVRLDLIVRTADAVAAAHSVGILHKDLKPSNILIRTEDGNPRPVLSDFGIGILTDRARLSDLKITQAGFTQSMLTENESSRTGTRMYSPPESLTDKPFTIQGDVYALGVMLYQMVVGDLERPLASGWEREVSDDLMREEIAACVEGNPARRTASATVVAQRLRSLDTTREQRRRQIAREAAAKTRAKRTRLAVALCVVLAALLITGGTTAYFYIGKLKGANVQITEQKNQALAEKNKADAQRIEAQKQHDNAEASFQFIQQALQSSDPNQGGRQDMLVTDAMANAIKKLDSGAYKDQPEIEARLRDTIAFILNDNGHTAEALPLARRALTLYQSVNGGDSPELAHSYRTVTYCLYFLGNYAEALPNARAALEMRQRLFKGDSREVAESLRDLAHCLDALGRTVEALPIYQAALEMRQRLFKGDDADVAQSLNSLGYGLYYLGRYQEALPKLQAALQMRQRLFTGDRPEVAESLNNVAYCLTSLGHSADALPMFQAALEMYQRLFKGDHPSVAMGLDNVGSCLCTLNRYVEAMPKLQAALHMRQRLYKGDHPLLAASLSNVAYCLNSVGLHELALPKYQAALAMYQRLYKADHPDLASSLTNLAICLQSMGRFQEALPNYEAALEMRQRLFKGDRAGVAISLYNVASCLSALGRPADALPDYQAAAEMGRRLSKGDNASLAIGLDGLATCLDSLGRKAEALLNYQAALEMRQRLFKGDRPGVAMGLYHVADCLDALGRHQEALPKFEAAVEMGERLIRGDSADLARGLNGLARCLLALGRLPEARQYAEQAVAMADRIWAEGDASRKACEETLAQIKAMAATRRATAPG